MLPASRIPGSPKTPAGSPLQGSTGGLHMAPPSHAASLQAALLSNLKIKEDSVNKIPQTIVKLVVLQLHFTPAAAAPSQPVYQEATCIYQ